MAQQSMSREHRIDWPVWSTHTRDWWKFLGAGPILVVAVVIGSGAGIDAWFVGVFTVILAFLLVAVGLVLGLGHLVARRRSLARA